MFIDDDSTFIDHIKDLAPRNRREVGIYLGSIAAGLVLSISSAFIAHEVYDHETDNHEHGISNSR